MGLSEDADWTELTQAQSYFLSTQLQGEQLWKKVVADGRAEAVQQLFSSLNVSQSPVTLILALIQQTGVFLFYIWTSLHLIFVSICVIAWHFQRGMLENDLNRNCSHACVCTNHCFLFALTVAGNLRHASCFEKQCDWRTFVSHTLWCSVDCSILNF